MMRTMGRLARELRTRGMSGFMRFVGSRLLQWRSDVLYAMELDALGTSTIDMTCVVTVNRHTLGTQKTRLVEADVLTAANHAYREALTSDAQLFALVDSHQHVQCYGFVLFESFYKRVLGEVDAVPMISNCYTLAENRGQGLYPKLLLAICHSLLAQGHKRVIITCAPDNLASVRGIEKARFNRVKTVHSTIVMARWIASQRIAPDQFAHAK